MLVPNQHPTLLAPRRRSPARRQPRCAALSLSAFRLSLATRNSQLATRPALTLIELLVSIVILVTLIAGVLPVISPNNDARKLREAGRQLSSLFAQAQAQAARDNRPVGVGFSDVWTDADGDNYQDPDEFNGVALEAYLIAEPPAFTGFNTSAAAVFSDVGAGAPSVKPGDPPLLNVTFGHGVGGEGMVADDPSDAIPPRMFRGSLIEPDGDIEGDGDVIDVGGELFEIIINDCDDEDTDQDPDIDVGADNVPYLKSQKVLTVRWLSWRGRKNSDGEPVLWPRGGKAYRIRRRPLNEASQSPSRTAAGALQFPRGVGIDLDATPGKHSLAIMFSPTGQVDAVYQDGERDDDDDADEVFILIGRVENVIPPITETPPGSGEFDVDFTRYDFSGSPDDEYLAQQRRELNLLNPDSRWVTVTRAGRILTSENATFDPRLTEYVDGTEADDTDDPQEQRDRQREAAQQYARELQNGSSN